MTGKLRHISSFKSTLILKNAKAQIAQLARTPQFAIVGILGVISPIDHLLHYSDHPDKLGGFAYWAYFGVAIFSASYVGLFLYLRMKDKNAQSKANKD